MTLLCEFDLLYLCRDSTTLRAGRRLNLPLRIGTLAHLLLVDFSRTLNDMEVHLTPELEAKLARSAAQQGREPGELVQQVAARYVDEESSFVDAVRRGEEALERGEYLTHEQVGHRLERFLQP